MIPTPARITEGRRCWYVWILIPQGGGRRYRLKVVKK